MTLMPTTVLVLVFLAGFAGGMALGQVTMLNIIVKLFDRWDKERDDLTKRCLGWTCNASN